MYACSSAPLFRFYTKALSVLSVHGEDEEVLFLLCAHGISVYLNRVFAAAYVCARWGAANPFPAELK